MNALYRLLRFSLASLILLLLAIGSLKAQRRDSVLVIQTGSGERYVCCYDFIVGNRHAKGLTIGEFRLKIISGRAQFLGGQSDSPPNWSIFQGTSTASWTANAQSVEIDSGKSATGFHICIRDTGVFRMTWETRTSDSLLYTDTLTFACIGKDCDEAFFNPVPSALSCGFDIDLVNGNRISRVINDFHLHMVTPGVSFLASPASMPARWNRIKAKPDSISYTSADSIRIGGFLQGFRVFVDAPKDSVFQIEWWSTNFGDEICRDTVTLSCSGLSRSDSVISRRATGSQDSCCRDFVLRNLHVPQGTISALALKILTPGAKLASPPAAPAGWTRTAFNAAGDSVAFRPASMLAVDDSVIFRSFCFDNHLAATDTISYRWETYGSGVEIETIPMTQVCYRMVTRCDSIAGFVDSLTSDVTRCLSLTVGNRNSRSTPIERIVFRISNAGTPRTITEASAPQGWTVAARTRDSVVFAGGYLEAGETQSGFDICTSLGDAGTQDPLKVYYRTSSSTESICSDTLRFDLKVSQLCDTAYLTEVPTSTPLYCCYRMMIQNRDTGTSARDRIVISVPNPLLVFSGAVAQSGKWTVATQSFPSTDIELVGDTIMPGGAATVELCLDTRFFQGRPSDLAVIWRTYLNGGYHCGDSALLHCASTTAPCDTFGYSIVSTGGPCDVKFTVDSRHVPSVPALDHVRFRVKSASGKIVSGGTDVTVTPDGKEAVLAKTIPAEAAGFDLTDLMIDFENQPITLELCSMNGDQAVCCQELNFSCQPAGVREAPATGAVFSLLDVTPNPVRSAAELRYQLKRGGPVTLVLTDASGSERRIVDLGTEGTGEHVVTIDVRDLSSGVYYCTLKSGSQSTTRRMVVVR
jgi:hypothetical protein